MLCDIGNGTMNLLRIVNRKPDPQRMFTEKYGTHQCALLIREQMMKRHKAEHGAAPFQRLHRILHKNFVIHPAALPPGIFVCRNSCHCETSPQTGRGNPFLSCKTHSLLVQIQLLAVQLPLPEDVRHLPEQHRLPRFRLPLLQQLQRPLGCVDHSVIHFPIICHFLSPYSINIL